MTCYNVNIAPVYCNPQPTVYEIHKDEFDQHWLDIGLKGFVGIVDWTHVSTEAHSILWEPRGDLVDHPDYGVAVQPVKTLVTKVRFHHQSETSYSETIDRIDGGTITVQRTAQHNEEITLTLTSVDGHVTGRNFVSGDTKMSYKPTMEIYRYNVICINADRKDQMIRGASQSYDAVLPSNEWDAFTTNRHTP